MQVLQKQHFSSPQENKQTNNVGIKEIENLQPALCFNMSPAQDRHVIVYFYQVQIWRVQSNIAW